MIFIFNCRRDRPCAEKTLNPGARSPPCPGTSLASLRVLQGTQAELPSQPAPKRLAELGVKLSRQHTGTSSRPFTGFARSPCGPSVTELLSLHVFLHQQGDDPFARKIALPTQICSKSKPLTGAQAGNKVSVCSSAERKGYEKTPPEMPYPFQAG